MPRVKIDYVVSFSSEDSENPASNLLSWEVNKKKWLCNKGESSCSVVLQLAKAVKINAIHIGAYHAALVEVLVGRSETPNEPFQVLVASCVFLSPAESRAAPTDKVRSFSAQQLGTAQAQRWDRVRVVCSQPYNKHCKYGLSFVHIYEPEEGAPSPAAAPAPAPLALPALDDEDAFTPGALFASHRRDAAAAIRRASSTALKTPTVTPDPPRIEGPARAESTRPETDRRDSKRRRDESPAGAQPSPAGGRPRAPERPTRVDDTTSRQKRRRSSSDGDRPTKTREKTKRGRTESRRTSESRVDSSEARDDVAPHEMLAGVVAVLSGYENPRRAALRNTALALGAAVRRDWGPACTHLVCAFPNTPKLRAVRGAARGGGVPVVTGEWVEQCARLRRRLPEPWFATEPALRVAPPPGALRTPPRRAPHSGTDTDDDMGPATPPRVADPAAPERIQGGGETAESSGSSTEEEEERAPREEIDGGRALPALLRGWRVALASEDGAGAGAGRLARYCRAYGALLVPRGELRAAPDALLLCRAGEERSEGEGEGEVRRVRAQWLWRCHERRAALPPDQYTI